MPLLPLAVRRPLGLAWLLLALVLAPTLGRMHQIVHGAPVLFEAQVHAEEGDTGQHAHDPLHALFAGHSSADCQVLDQHTLGGALLAQALALAQLVPQDPPAAQPTRAPSLRRLAAFHARAPPAQG